MARKIKNLTLQQIYEQEPESLSGIIADAQGFYFEYCILENFYLLPQGKKYKPDSNSSIIEIQNAISIMQQATKLPPPLGNKYQELKSTIEGAAKHWIKTNQLRLLSLIPIGGNESVGDFQAIFKEKNEKVTVPIEAKFYTGSPYKGVKYWTSTDSKMLAQLLPINLIPPYLWNYSKSMPGRFWHIGDGDNIWAKRIVSEAFPEMLETHFQSTNSSLLKSYFHYLMNKSEQTYKPKTLARGVDVGEGYSITIDLEAIYSAAAQLTSMETKLNKQSLSFIAQADNESYTLGNISLDDTEKDLLKSGWGIQPPDAPGLTANLRFMLNLSKKWVEYISPSPGPLKKNQ